jgi:sulfur-oxidizing protein SoxZ|tara:strand:- start:676 stop:1002 length:327 start_codon:yes stop_codon:yes gene_type:complete
MSSIKPRVKVPKEVSIDEIIEIKTLIRHPMHSGRMKDNNGQIIPRQIINSFSAKFNGKEVFQMDLEPSISTNPFIVFQYKVKESGKFDFEWIDDNGEKYYISKEMTVS